MTTINIKLNTSDLPEVLSLLEQLGNEALLLLPNLLEPWQILSEEGLTGQKMNITIHAKARYGKAAEMRLRLIPLVQEHLNKIGVELID